MKLFTLKLIRRFINSIPGVIWSNGTLKLIFGGMFYKIGFGKNKLKIKQENYNFIALKDTAFQNYLPTVKYIENSVISYFIMPLMQSLRTSDAELEIILKNISKEDSVENVQDTILPRLLEYADNEDIMKDLNSFSGLIVRVGFIHGDLHRWNVLLDSNRQLKLIDFDLVDRRWCRSFDLINIFISDLIIEENKPWKESFFALCENLHSVKSIDSEWLDRPYDCIRFDMCSYFLKRSQNEKSKVLVKDWKRIIEILNNKLRQN